MSFMLLKVRSTVAVMTESTIKMAVLDNFARLGKEVAIVVLSRGDSTCCKEFFLWCRCISRQKSFHSDSVSSGSISGSDEPVCPSNCTSAHHTSLLILALLYLLNWRASEASETLSGLFN